MDVINVFKTKRWVMIMSNGARFYKTTSKIASRNEVKKAILKIANQEDKVYTYQDIESLEEE